MLWGEAKMRPVQSLYYDHGQMYCPVHGRNYIRLTTDDTEHSKFCWCCSAILPDGTRCVHLAAWNSIADIHDTELESLAVEHMRDRSTQH